MAISIMLLTDRNMGDHGELQRIAIPYVEGETVRDLIARVRDAHGMYGGTRGRSWNVFDVIELRLESEPALPEEEKPF